jgi:hypothetical protein
MARPLWRQFARPCTLTAPSALRLTPIIGALDKRRGNAAVSGLLATGRRCSVLLL